MSLEQWVPPLVAVAGALGVREIIPAIIRYLSGASEREKRRVQEIIHDRDDQAAGRQREAERADREASRRRRLEEYASALRRDLIDRGAEPTEIEPWPS